MPRSISFKWLAHASPILMLLLFTTVARARPVPYNGYFESPDDFYGDTSFKKIDPSSMLKNIYSLDHARPLDEIARIDDYSALRVHYNDNEPMPTQFSHSTDHHWDQLSDEEDETQPIAVQISPRGRRNRRRRKGNPFPPVKVDPDDPDSPFFDAGAIVGFKPSGPLDEGEPNTKGWSSAGAASVAEGEALEKSDATITTPQCGRTTPNTSKTHPPA